MIQFFKDSWAPMLWCVFLVFVFLLIVANIFDLICWADSLFGTLDRRCGQ